MVILFGFQCWSLWSWRRQVSDSGLDAMAMVELEIERSRISLRYWRVSIWLAVAMWVALYALAMLGVSASGADTGDVVARKLVHALGAVGLVGIGFALWAWWSGRRTRAHLAKMLALRDEMRRD